MTAFDAPETEQARRARLAWEAARIEEGLADLAATRTVSREAVRAWVDSLDTPNDVPVPRSRI